MRFLLGMVRHSSAIRYDSHQPTWSTPSIAINWQHYVEKMLEIIDAEPLLRNAASAERHGEAPQPDDRPLTKLESLDLKLGHGMRDLAFKRI